MAPVKKTWLWVVIVLGMPLPLAARVSGPCVNCHTMHNSQAGSPMAYTMSGATKTYTGVANKGLLTTDCVGCHQGVNSGGPVPYVFSAALPEYGDTGTEGNTLAGGNFHWVSTGLDRTGHNVAGLALGDLAHGNLPPGGTVLASQLTCAGTYGCHGDRNEADSFAAMSGAHHGANDVDTSGNGFTDGSTLANSYRFLLDVQGLEDDDWEYDATGHNLYYGVHRSSDSTDNEATISSLCGQCHGAYHAKAGGMSVGGSMTSPWLRHPTDYDMSRTAAESEYRSYNGDKSYSMIAPVASSNVSATKELPTDIYAATGDAIVMCLSCHRAHGSPYDGILRWDYKSWPCQNEGTECFNGCATCHTAKN